MTAGPVYSYRDRRLDHYCLNGAQIGHTLLRGDVILPALAANGVIPPISAVDQEAMRQRHEDRTANRRAWGRENDK